VLRDFGATGVNGPFDGLALEVWHDVVERLADIAVVVALVDQELGLKKRSERAGCKSETTTPGRGELLLL
jgi:hypothetical protein